MKNTKTQPEKIWLGFAIVTIICGILLVFEGNFVSGISGSIVGSWLAFENYQKLKNKNGRT